MATENEVDTEVESDDSNAASGDAPPTNPVSTGKNIVLPKAAFNARIQAATERGKKAALMEMDEAVKEHGFESLKDMFSTVASLKRGNGSGRQQARAEADPDIDREVVRREPPARPNESEAQYNARLAEAEKKWQADLAKEKQSRENEQRARVQAENRRKELERKLEMQEAEHQLREAAINAGIKAVDYAITLLKRNIKGKSVEELNKFDEAEFFSGLREKSPYLFGETVKPATTGTGGKTPQAPGPGKVAKDAAESSQVDAKKMNDAEFKAHMQKRGLNLDIAGI